MATQRKATLKERKLPVKNQNEWMDRVRVGFGWFQVSFPLDEGRMGAEGQDGFVSVGMNDDLLAC